MNGFFRSEAKGRGAIAPAPSDVFGRFVAFLKSREDREHEIAINRFAMGIAGLVALAVARMVGMPEWAQKAYWLDLYVVSYNLVLGGHLLFRPAPSIPRRVLGVFCDLSALSLTMRVGGAPMACFYPILLWVIFGYGFRFGVRYLFIGTGIAVVEFSLVVNGSSFWLDNIAMSVGLLLGLVILPVYTSVLIRQLSEAKRLAEEANKAKTMFLASVSHELRTPLNAIIGLSDLLSDSRLDEEQTDMSRVIARSGRSLLSLINSILEISRMECGYPNMKVDDVDLFSFLSDLHDMLAVQANAKNLRFTLHFRPNAPRYASFNARHVEEVLVNLAGNGIKFTDSGHVTILVGAGRGEAGASAVRFEVVDTGIGIAPKSIDKIFQRFTQADETILDRYGGTGLGLAIAKQLVEGMGGEIGVESALGHGSNFWFEIPADCKGNETPPSSDDEILVLTRDATLRDVASRGGASVRVASSVATLVAMLHEPRIGRHAKPIALIDARGADDPKKIILDVFERTIRGEVSLIGVFDQNADSPAPEILSMLNSSIQPPWDPAEIARICAIAASGRRGVAVAASETPGQPPSLNILVAEDNKTNQLVIRKILERAGHKSTIVADGQAALEKLNETRFDLALIDLNMPVMNGIDAAKLYRFSAPDHERAPLVALTADATEEAQRRCLDAGMIACITKPVEPSQLIAWLDAFARELRRPTASPQPDGRNSLDEVNEPDPIDNRALDDLKSLGGDAFVTEIVDQFLGDAAAVLRGLHEAVERGDVQRFRDEAHALRSCAANVGAQKVYKLCLEWRSIDARELALEGELRIRRLEREFERARDALACFRRSDGAC